MALEQLKVSLILTSLCACLIVALALLFVWSMCALTFISDRSAAVDSCCFQQHRSVLAVVANSVAHCVCTCL